MFLEPAHNDKNESGTPAGKVTAKESQHRYARRRRFLRTGQAIMLGGAVIGVIHWLTHIGVFGAAQPPLWLDLLAGYPMAALLIMVGAITASKK